MVSNVPTDLQTEWRSSVGPYIYWADAWMINCPFAWWRHQMETFSALLAICAGNSPVTGEFPIQRPVTRSFDVYFDLRPNERLSKQSWGWWFETLSSPLWRHRNGIGVLMSLTLVAFIVLILEIVWSCVRFIQSSIHYMLKFIHFDFNCISWTKLLFFQNLETTCSKTYCNLLLYIHIWLLY